MHWIVRPLRETMILDPSCLLLFSLSANINCHQIAVRTVGGGRQLVLSTVIAGDRPVEHLRSHVGVRVL
jgi:hypothetical protein